MLILLAIVAVLIIISPFFTGWLVSRQRRRTIDIILTDRVRDATEERPREVVHMSGYVVSQSEAFFRDDPLGSHCLPDILEEATLAPRVLAELVASQVVSSTPTTIAVSAMWIPWGYEPQVPRYSIIDDTDIERTVVISAGNQEYRGGVIDDGQQEDHERHEFGHDDQLAIAGVQA